MHMHLGKIECKRLFLEMSVLFSRELVAHFKNSNDTHMCGELFSENLEFLCLDKLISCKKKKSGSACETV